MPIIFTYSGESILLDATFTNGTSRRIQPEAALYQTQTFAAGGKTRTRRSRFTSVTGGRAVAAAEDGTWDGLPLKIPAVTPTIDNCVLIKVEYAVKVSLHTLTL